jgi:FADH2 O2-dependent halogenase
LQTNTAAWFTHFENCGATIDWLRGKGASTDDFPYPIDQAAVHHLFRDGWMWQIGFEGNLTSVGFVQVYDSRGANKGALGASPVDTGLQWAQILASRPVLKTILNDALIAPVPGRILSTSRVQRLSSAACGENWVAMPFTVGFIDPLHSTGIAHSLSGVGRVCQALLCSSVVDRKTMLQQYADELFAEFQHVDQLIAGCYQALADFRLFNCWTMLYFAAATTFERRHRQGEHSSFLLSGDLEFRRIVQQARNSLDNMTRFTQGSIEDRLIEGYQHEVKDLIAPYNHVGLFAPQINNMYWHTAAEKYD